MSEEEVKTTKIIKFSGSKDDWPIWSEKFLARARRVGYKDILLGNVIVPDDDTDIENLSDDEAKKTIKLGRMKKPLRTY